MVFSGCPDDFSLSDRQAKIMPKKTKLDQYIYRSKTISGFQYSLMSRFRKSFLKFFPLPMFNCFGKSIKIYPISTFLQIYLYVSCSNKSISSIIRKTMPGIT